MAGRRTKLTQEMVDQAIRLKADGLSNGDIISALGIHPSTFYPWIGEPRNRLQRELSDGLKKEESEFKRALLTTIRAAAIARNQYWTAAAWLLERKYPDEYGRAERRRDDGDGGGEAPQIVLGVVAKPVQQIIDFGALEGPGKNGTDASLPSSSQPGVGEGTRRRCRSGERLKLERLSSSRERPEMPDCRGDFADLRTTVRSRRSRITATLTRYRDTAHEGLVNRLVKWEAAPTWQRNTPRMLAHVGQGLREDQAREKTTTESAFSIIPAGRDESPSLRRPH